MMGLLLVNFKFSAALNTQITSERGHQDSQELPALKITWLITVFCVINLLI